MKKKITLFYLFLVFGIFYCKDSNQLETTPNVSLEKNPVQLDIIDYIINNMRPLLETFDQAMNDFSTVSVTYSDSYGGMLTAIENDIIPKFKKLIKDLENVKPKTEEVRKIHEIFIKATKDILSALELMKKGLKNENPDLMEEANDKITKSNNTFEIFKEKITVLCKEHKVEYLISTD